MEYVELVIKIPEKWLDDMVRGEFTEVDELCTDIVQYSTPLPKGHGKLKDADKIVTEIDRAYPNLDRQDIKQWVFNAETIIEADAPKRRKGTPLPKGRKIVKGVRDPYKVDQIDAILDSPDFYAYLSGDKTSGAKTINLDGFALKVLKALYEGKTVTIKEESV